MRCLFKCESPRSRAFLGLIAWNQMEKIGRYFFNQASQSVRPKKKRLGAGPFCVPQSFFGVVLSQRSSKGALK